MRALVVPSLLLAAACAGSPTGDRPLPASRPSSVTASGSGADVFLAPDRSIVSDAIQAPADAVWAALKETYAELGIRIEESDEASRQLGNRRFVVSRRLAGTPLSRYLECGSGITGAFADAYRVEMRIHSTVASAGGETRIETWLEARARNPEGTSSQAVQCSSTQRLEREIAERVRGRVSARS